MTEHTKTDGLPGLETAALPQVLERSRPRNERMAGNKIECNACPVLCQITEGKSGACDRYANVGGALVRVDPVVLLRREAAPQALVAFDAAADEPPPSPSDAVFVTGVGSSTTGRRRLCVSASSPGSNSRSRS